MASQLKDLRSRDNTPEPTSSISSKPSSSSKPAATHGGWGDEVKQSGHKFMAMHRPWEPDSFVGEIEEAKVTNPFNVLRYTNKALESQCQYAEIYSVIPKTEEHIEMLANRLPEYIKLVRSSSLFYVHIFISLQFQAGLSSARTIITFKLKQIAGEVYESSNHDHPNFFTTRNDPEKRSKNDEAHKLLGFNPIDKTYSRLPPLLYKGFVTEDPNGLFRNEEMMQVR